MADEYLHRVTVEFIERRAEVHDFGSAEDALSEVEAAKRNAEAWHVWYAVVQDTAGDEQRVVTSLYRSLETHEWQSLVLSSVASGCAR